MNIFDSIKSHDIRQLQMLLDGGADPNLTSPEAPAWVPLKQAVEELAVGGPIEAVALLLRAGADVDGGREPGNATPLIVAAMNRQFEAVLLLLAAGADPNVRDDEGDTPLSLSAKNLDGRLTTLLRVFGAKDNA